MSSVTSKKVGLSKEKKVRLGRRAVGEKGGDGGLSDERQQ